MTVCRSSRVNGSWAKAKWLTAMQHVARSGRSLIAGPLVVIARASLIGMESRVRYLIRTKAVPTQKLRGIGTRIICAPHLPNPILVVQGAMAATRGLVMKANQECLWKSSLTIMSRITFWKAIVSPAVRTWGTTERRRLLSDVQDFKSANKVLKPLMSLV